ncbi:histone H1 [Mucilaginibacter daejeonensis]|uniref:histone H1 n=1 Tax=Mucilaginibacter daejeonensis TaxID=398049 RepID=UPI001D170EB4|nr:histone H1 [Mucilaginibacter daejeonensis]UEG52429.1 histone H1 [Mucilaginibacter daejeonensis]
MEKFNQLKEVIAASEADFTAFFEKGNKAAGTRVRNAMQQLKALAQEVREEVTTLKNKEK